MEFSERKEGPVTVLSISGRLDAVTAPAYEQRTREVIEAGNSLLVLDLEQLRYISSAGLRSLLTTANWLKEKDGRLCFANPTQNVRAVFEMCRFTEIFRIEASVADAVAALS